VDLGLEGKRCLVTGSTGGIGLEVTRQLLGEGARVVTCGRRPAPEVGETAHVSTDLSHPGEPERAVAEMRRVLRPGGWLHLLLEDYDLLQAFPASEGLARFWELPRAFARASRTDMHVGRRGFALLHGAGLVDVREDDVVVDTLRVPRDVIAGIIEAWRDGYTEVLARHAGTPASKVRGWWEEMLAVIRDPGGYFVWRIPVWSGRVPGGDAAR
jgi:NAD(P)-dependent dehydrogenase (short-subunit alcohol dehydrogenase family)